MEKASDRSLARTTREKRPTTRKIGTRCYTDIALLARLTNSWWRCGKEIFLTHGLLDPLVPLRSKWGSEAVEGSASNGLP
jgi:hypothetical protein